MGRGTSGTGDQYQLEVTGPGAQLAIPSPPRIWLGDRDRE